MKLISETGRYFIMLSQVFSKPERFIVYWRQTVFEVNNIGVKSLGIVSLLSVFMGAVITLQTASNIDSAWIPVYTIGFTVRQTMILEFSPTIISLILAGKVGSNIASEIGTMRVSEQIDALEIMGINSASFLILPKILAALFIFPFLIVISMFLGIYSGALVGNLADVITLTDFSYGIRYDFDDYTVLYALVKTLVFAFIITSVSGFHGYFTKGGALQVGQSSTRAVTNSSVLIILSNYVLTQMMLL